MCDIEATFLDRQIKSKIVQAKDGDRGVENETPARFPEVWTCIRLTRTDRKRGGKVDAVVVSTADHHHSPAFIRTIRKKMHVYCEKPLAHTVVEARLLVEEAAKAGVATQMGTQIHAGDNY